jgi:cation/acetate symporter
MVVVSRLTRSRVPAHVGRFMVRLHAPVAVVLDRS